jgi:hypothetical protein
MNESLAQLNEMLELLRPFATGIITEVTIFLSSPDSYDLRHIYSGPPRKD